MRNDKIVSIAGVVGFLLAGWASGAGAGARLFLPNGYGPAWSPDGTAIACTRPTPTWSDEDMQVWIAPLDGSPPDTLTHDPSGAFLPQWALDGQRLAYCRNAEFVIVNLEGEPLATWGTPDLQDDWGIAVAPDGRVLYTRDLWPASEETWALDLETGTSEFVAAGAGGVISPDGLSIACTVQDTLVVGPLGQAPTHRLGLGAYASWTPDSRYIVYTEISSSGSADLFLVSADGSYKRQLTFDPEIEWNGKISPAGTSVVYSRSISDVQPHDIWILDLELPPTRVETRTWSEIKAGYRGNRAPERSK